MLKRKLPYKKIMLALSVCLIVVWAVLGTGASLAWFTDSTPEVKNIFHFAEFDLVVSHRLEDGSYEEIQMDTKIFDDEAIYEPGYVQVVYLKIENRGTVPFDFHTAVSVTDFGTSTNVFGTTFNLRDHLEFGLVSAKTEAELEAIVEPRRSAVEIANMPLSHYSTDIIELDAGEEMYMALVVRMPEEVGNEANYKKGYDIPYVELGVIFNATQQNKD